MSKLKCPRCSAAIDAVKDELGIITCSSCGARLRTKAPTKTTVRDSPAASPSEEASRDEVDRVMARVDRSDPNETLRPAGQAAVPRPQPSEPLPSATLDALLAELRAVRQTQEEILALLKANAASADRPGLRTRPPRLTRRSGDGRRVIVADDDAATMQAAVNALRAAAMSVVTVAGGDACLAAIAKDKPDAVVLELALAGDMPAKDVINVIKATMEWVDIPIVLYTRTPFQDEAELLRTYSADAVVAKAPGSEQSLCARVNELLAQAAASV